VHQDPIPPQIQVSERNGKPGLKYNFHPGQERAWDAEKRIVAIIAGTRSGKTSFGPLSAATTRSVRSPAPSAGIRLRKC
jgi:hypothetical protein